MDQAPILAGGDGFDDDLPPEAREGWLLVRVHVPELNVFKCLQFPSDRLIWDVKQQVLASLPKVNQKFNYSHYIHTIFSTTIKPHHFNRFVFVSNNLFQGNAHKWNNMNISVIIPPVWCNQMAFVINFNAILLLVWLLWKSEWHLLCKNPKCRQNLFVNMDIMKHQTIIEQDIKIWTQIWIGF